MSRKDSISIYSSALVRAAEDGKAELCSQLIKNGATVNSTDEDSWGPLMFAAENGHDLCARVLLENGAAVDAQNKKGWTALMYSAQNGRDLCARVLLENGANPELKTTLGSTALMLSKDFRRENCARLLRCFQLLRKWRDAVRAEAIAVYWMKLHAMATFGPGCTASMYGILMENGREEEANALYTSEYVYQLERELKRKRGKEDGEKGINRAAELTKYRCGIQRQS